MRNPAMMTPVMQTNSSRDLRVLPVAATGIGLISIIGLVLIGDIVARSGPPT